MCTLVLMFVIMLQFHTNDSLVPNKLENLHNATYANVSFSTVVEAMPYITFLYLFQPNVPQTY